MSDGSGLISGCVLTMPRDSGLCAKSHTGIGNPARSKPDRN